MEVSGGGFAITDYKVTGHRCEPVYTVTGMGIDFYEWASLGACLRSHVRCAMGIFVSPIINVIGCRYQRHPTILLNTITLKALFRLSRVL